MIGFFFFSSRRRHTRWPRDWSSDVCSSDLVDWGGTLAITTVASILWMVPLLMSGKSVDDMTAEVASLSYRITIIALGAVMSVLGGYTAAAWARRRPELH